MNRSLLIVCLAKSISEVISLPFVFSRRRKFRLALTLFQSVSFFTIAVVTFSNSWAALEIFVRLGLLDIFPLELRFSTAPKVVFLLANTSTPSFALYALPAETLLASWLKILSMALVPLL